MGNQITRSEVERVLGAVEWGNDGEGTCCCPFHDDRNPSCSINIEKGVFFCHACGEKGTLRKLFERFGSSVSAPVEEEQTPYDYRDAEGVLSYQSVR